MRIDGLIKGLNITTPEQGITDNLLGRVSTGNILRARVIETNGPQALLRLSDGTVLNASLLQAMNFKQGEVVDFVVKGRSGDKLVLETLKNINDARYINEQKNIVGTELKLLDIQVTDDTLNAALALKNAGVKINTSAIDRVSAAVTGFGLTAEEAVFLLNAGMDINDENVSALLQLTRNNYKIGDSLQKLDGFVQSINRLSGANQTQEMNNANTATTRGIPVTNAATGNTVSGTNISTAEIGTVAVNSQGFGGANPASSTNSVSAAILPQQGQMANQGQSEVNIASGSNLPSTAPNMPAYITTAQTANTASVGSGTDTKANAAGITTVINTLPEATISPTGRNEANIAAAGMRTLIGSIPENSPNYQAGGTNMSEVSITGGQPYKNADSINTTGNIYANTNLPASADAAKGAGYAASETSLIHRQSYTASNDGNSDQSGSDGPDRAKVLGLSGYDKIFLKPENSLSVDDIQKAYRALLENLHSTRELLVQNTVSVTDDVLSRLSNLENNIRFINDLSSCYTYFQIPVSLQQDTTAQLYIMRKNKFSKTIDPENATLYISLDTLNMGQVDSLIRVDKKTISINLRAETPKAVSLFKNCAGILYNMLQNQGYKLVDYRCSVTEKPANILNVAEILQIEFGMRNRTIDYRL